MIQPMSGDRLRILAAASIAGVVAGVATGLMARLAMRFIVVLRGETPEFSLGGTAGILFAFVLMAGALAMTYALVTRGFRRGPGPGGWALVGLALLAGVLVVTPLRQEISRGPAFVGLFIPVGLFLGWMAAWVGKRLTRRLPEPTGGVASTGYALLAVPGLLSLVALLLLIVFGILQTVGVIPVPTS